MAIPTYEYVWEQGTDLELKLVYKEGPAGGEQPVDLTNYAIRMDIRSSNTNGLVYTFNSADLADISDTTKEATLGADGSITILVPRSLTLPGGAIFTLMDTGTFVYAYDIILRNNTNNRQLKMLSGTISINKTVTLWL